MFVEGEITIANSGTQYICICNVYLRKYMQMPRGYPLVAFVAFRMEFRQMQIRIKTMSLRINRDKLIEKEKQMQKQIQQIGLKYNANMWETIFYCYFPLDLCMAN